MAGDNPFQSSNQVVTSTTGGKEPWAPAQDAMKLGIKDATDLYNNKSGFQPFGKSLAVGRSAKSQEGMGGIENSAAVFGADLAKPLGFNTGLMNSGGWNTRQIDAMDNYANRAGSGGLNAFTNSGIGSLDTLNNQMMSSGGLSSLQNQAAAGFGDMVANGGLTASQQGNMNQLGHIAAGGQLNGNPYLDGVINDVVGDMTTAQNRNAMAAGRYGSDEHADIVSRNAGEISRQMRMGDYGQQLGRMDNAIRDQFGMAQTGIGTQSGAYGAMGNLGQSGLVNQTNAAQSLFGAGDAAFQNVGAESDRLFSAGQQGIANQAAAGDQMANSYNLMQQPYRDLMGIGQMEEEDAARQLQDELRVHQEAQAEPWDRLLAMQGIVTGAGRVGGQANQTSTVTRPGTSPFQTFAGSALQGMDMGMDPFQAFMAGFGGSGQGY